MARGDIVGFLDADDLWPVGKLESQLAYLNENPRVEIVLGLVQYLRAGADQGNGAPFEEFAAPRVDVNLGSALFRRSVFDRVGFFDETMRHSEDVDWFLRARELGISIGALQEVGLQYRIHQHNMSRHKNARDRYFALALKRSLDRRRRLSDEAEELPGLPDAPQV
jgi:GT2 family glycosyltransferase